ncbi:hypothetical protein L4D20_20680 [Vibrio kyushuensis]|uniref:hypothetical protein n=1 Tax=Vibrio kyushuensis TaxID=2910249 RepID=UPI003D0BE50F
MPSSDGGKPELQAYSDNATKELNTWLENNESAKALNIETILLASSSLMGTQSKFDCLRFWYEKIK